jgi:hypothetical protein
MTDFARFRPARILRSARRRILELAALKSGQRPEDRARQIVTLTLSQLAGRIDPPRYAVTFSDQMLYRRDGVFRRDGAGYVLELPTIEFGHDSIDKAWELGSAYLYWLMHCPGEVESMSVTLSDGDAPSAARFSPSTNRSDVVPIPDPYFFRFSGFEGFRRLAEGENVAWSDRSGDIIWRGASSGDGTFDPLLGAQQSLRAAQRLELILAASKVPGVDAGLSHYRRDEFKPELLEQLGVLKQPIPEQSWVRRKFAIDVDGQTNTWSNLIVRMHLGCCVLKLDSKYGYRQWYYDRLKPWEHYVPVKADASDLGERIEWLRSNDARAREIAANGQQFARSLSFEVGRREAVELITTHLRA